MTTKLIESFQQSSGTGNSAPLILDICVGVFCNLPAPLPFFDIIFVWAIPT